MPSLVCACGKPKARQAKVCRACFDAANVRRPPWRARNLEASRAYLRARNLKKKYGLTPDEWLTMFEGQDCRCAICGTDDPGMKSGWSTDHDHDTGEVRGILCYRCNRTLGFLGDNAAGVQSSAAQFLRYLDGGDGGDYEPGLGAGLLC